MPDTLPQVIRAQSQGAYADLTDKQLEAAVLRMYPDLTADQIKEALAKRAHAVAPVGAAAALRGATIAPGRGFVPGLPWMDKVIPGTRHDDIPRLAGGVTPREAGKTALQALLMFGGAALPGAAAGMSGRALLNVGRVAKQQGAREGLRTLLHLAPEAAAGGTIGAATEYIPGLGTRNPRKGFLWGAALGVGQGGIGALWWHAKKVKMHRALLEKVRGTKGETAARQKLTALEQQHEAMKQALEKGGSVGDVDKALRQHTSAMSGRWLSSGGPARADLTKEAARADVRQAERLLGVRLPTPRKRGYRQRTAVPPVPEAARRAERSVTAGRAPLVRTLEEADEALLRSRTGGPTAPATAPAVRLQAVPASSSTPAPSPVAAPPSVSPAQLDRAALERLQQLQRIAREQAAPAGPAAQGEAGLEALLQRSLKHPPKRPTKPQGPTPLEQIQQLEKHAKKRPVGEVPTPDELVEYVIKTKGGQMRSTSWTIDAVAKKWGLKESDAEKLVRGVLARLDMLPITKW